MDYGVVLVDDQGAVSVESGDSPRLVKGLNSLFQSVVIELLSDHVPGRGGSGFARALTETRESNSNAISVFDQRLRLARENVLTAQQDALLPLDEQLETLDLLSANWNGEGWDVEILLVNRSGDSIQRVFSGGE